MLWSVHTTEARSDGPPVSMDADLCKEMAPKPAQGAGHTADAQSGGPPYTITTFDTQTCYKPGEPVTGKTLNCTTRSF